MTTEAESLAIVVRAIRDLTKRERGARYEAQTEGFRRVFARERPSRRGPMLLALLGALEHHAPEQLPLVLSALVDVTGTSA